MNKTNINDMLEAHGVKLTEIVAWTMGYFPFTMGGKVWRPMMCRLPCDKPIHAGKGFYICLLNGPDGFTKVAEVTTGAIVGDSIEEVTSDIESCDDIEFMKNQVNEAKEKMVGGQLVEPEEFWRRLRKD